MPARTPLVNPATARRKTLAALALGHALLDWNGGFWPIFKYLAGMDLGVAGVMASVPSFFGSLLQPIFGHLAETGRARFFVLGGIALTFFMTLLGPLALGRQALGSGLAITLMVTALCLTRLGQAMFHPVAGSQAGGLERGRRATLLAVFVAVGWAGVSLSQPLFSWAYLATGGHTEILLVPSLLLLVLIAVWYRPVRTPIQVSGRKGGGTAPVPRRRLVVLFAILALADFLCVGWGYLMPEFMEQKGCPAFLIRGGGAFIMILGTVTMMVPAGMMADRYGRRRMIAGTLGLALMFYLGLLAVPFGSPVLLSVLLFMFGGMVGVANPLGVAHGQELMPHRASTVSGFMMGWAWAVGSLGSAVAGAIARVPGQGAVGAMRWLILANVAALVLALVFLAARHPARIK
jgi:FSR family fosmidomycin resistance protein-like MFS transporter